MIDPKKLEESKPNSIILTIGSAFLGVHRYPSFVTENNLLRHSPTVVFEKISCTRWIVFSVDDVGASCICCAVVCSKVRSW